MVLDTFDVAELLECRMRDVWRLVESGRLRFVMVGGVYRFRECDVAAYVADLDTVRKVRLA